MLPIEQFSMFRTNRSIDKYEGIYNNNSFKLRRLLSKGYSSFLPIAKLNVRSYNNGTKIIASFSYHIFVKVFLILSFSFLFFLLINSINYDNDINLETKELLNEIRGSESVDSSAQNQVENKIERKRIIDFSELQPLFLMLVLYILAFVLFKKEVEITKMDLKLFLGNMTEI